MISKETYTKIFLQQWDKSMDDANVKLFQRKWFTNNRTKVGGGLRLTDDGYEFLIKEIEYFLIYNFIDQNLVLKMDYYTLCFFIK